MNYETELRAELTADTLPRYSINGSHRRHLMEPLLAALLGLQTLQDLLKECAPHGRDYADNTLNLAIKNHGDRVNAISDVHEDLMNLAVHIDQTWPSTIDGQR